MVGRLRDAGVGIVLFGLVTGGAAMAQAVAVKPETQKDLNPEVVRKLMKIAFDSLPTQTNRADGTVLTIDKKKQDSVLIPFDDAKRVIKSANLAADAQICNLPDLQSAFHATMVRDERKRNKWSEEQIEYVKRLYVFTVSLRVGRLEAEEDTGKQQTAAEAQAEAKAKIEEAARTPTKFECSEEKRARTKADIETFITTASKS